jgi:hypothetical protein
LKKAGKKKEQAPYKIILNGTFGISNDKYSLAYDPRRNHEVCINGQLLLLDLIEKLEPYCEVINSNTDGLIIMIGDSDEEFNRIDDICYEWEQRSKMSLGFDFIKEIYQGDVNNYIFTFEDGGYERKGAYVKKLGRLDYDLPIVNKAIVEYLTKGTPVEKTIYGCDDLIEFQQIVRLQGSYVRALWGDKPLNGKTFRVFASASPKDDGIYKQKENKNKEKFANTSPKVFIWNESVNGVKCPSKLDKRYYVEMAKKRLQDKFGV